MSSDIFESARRVVGLIPQYVGDTFIEKKLRQTVDNHISEAGKDDIAKVGFYINGKEYPLVLDAICDVHEIKEIDLSFSEFNPAAPWVFSVPTTKIKMLPNGVGWLHLRDKPEESDYDVASDQPLGPGHPSMPPSAQNPDGYTGLLKQNIKTMFRLYTTRYFKPQTAKAGLAVENENENVDSVPYGLLRIEQLWDNIRHDGIIPMQVKLCAYSQTTRYSYHIDLLRGKLLRDLRDDHIPHVNHFKRTGLEFFQLDRVMTMNDVPELSKKILEIIFESKEVDVVELAHIFHSQEKRIDQYIDVLMRKGFVQPVGKPPNEKYVANIDAMGKTSSQST